MREKLRDIIDSYAAEKGFSGVIRITMGDQILLDHAVGYEDAEQKIPFSEQSMFTFYSMSKPLCTFGVMRLADRGVLSLDAHPAEYLPMARGLHPDLTLRCLLNHTSGLPDFEQTKDFYERYGADESLDIRDLLPEMLSYPMEFAPSQGAKYANVNFVMCTMIIEALSGQCYDDYMKNEVFLPLGMKHARLDHPDTELPHRVVGYNRDESGRIFPVRRAYFGCLGAGDIVGRLEDAYCLYHAVRERKLLTDAAWSEILTPSPLNGMGLGCWVTPWHGTTRILHTGGHTGYRNLHAYLPQEDFDILLLSNYGFGRAREELSNEIYVCIFGEDDALSVRVQMDQGYIKPV